MLFALYIVTFVETFDAACRIHHAAFAGEEGAVAAICPEFFFVIGGDYCRRRKLTAYQIFRMNFLFIV